MADAVPFQERLAPGAVFLVRLPPVGAYVAAQEEEALDRVQAADLGAPEPVGVEGQDEEGEGQRDKEGAPDKEGDDGEKDEGRQGFQDALDEGPGVAQQGLRESGALDGEGVGFQVRLDYGGAVAAFGVPPGDVPARAFGEGWALRLDCYPPSLLVTASLKSGKKKATGPPIDLSHACEVS